MFVLKRYHDDKKKVSDTMHFESFEDVLKKKYSFHRFFDAYGNWLPNMVDLYELSVEKMKHLKENKKVILTHIKLSIKSEKNINAYIFHDSVEECRDAILALSKNTEPLEDNAYEFDRAISETGLEDDSNSESESDSSEGSSDSDPDVYFPKDSKNTNLQEEYEKLKNCYFFINRESFSLKIMSSKIVSLNKKFYLYKKGDCFSLNLVTEKDEEEHHHLRLNILNRDNSPYIDMYQGIIHTEQEIDFTPC